MEITSADRNRLVKKRIRLLEKGDMFVLPSGLTIYEIKYTDCGEIKYVPVNGTKAYTRYFYQHDEVYFVPKIYLSSDLPQKDTNMTNTLYQTKEATPRFGNKIAVNSQGLAVLEMKPDGSIECFKHDEIEVVTPYTVLLKNMNGGDLGQFTTTKGSVKKGDLLILTNGTIASVYEIDTKHQGRTHELKGRRVVTEEIKE